MISAAQRWNAEFDRLRAPEPSEPIDTSAIDDLTAAAARAEAEYADSEPLAVAESPCTMDEYCKRDRPPPAQFVDIAAGRRHTCGLLADGRVQCWGSTTSPYGRDVYTGTASSSTASNFVRIDSHGGGTCGLRADTSLFCWFGERELPPVRPFAWEPPRPFESGSYTDFAVSGLQVCALDLDGRAECWPFFDWDWLEPMMAAPSPRLSNLSFASMDAGAAHVCGLHHDRAIHCWGSNEADQLSAPGGTSWMQISAGAGHTCALDASGVAVCWGDNSFGQSTPPSNIRFSSLSAGELHSCGLLHDGTARCWGGNIDGQSSPPTGVAFSAISAGAHHTCGLTPTGEARCWGLDAYGQATPPPALSRFTRLFTGWEERGNGGPVLLCGLRIDGRAQCWGEGQDPSDPALENARFAEIGIGRDFACGLLLDGRAACWRYRLGYSDSAVDAVIANVPSDLRFTSLMIVGSRACGLTIERTIHCWGPDQNFFGRELPSPPPGEHIAIASNGYSACTIDLMGAIRCWDYGHEFLPDLAELASPREGDSSPREDADTDGQAGGNYQALTISSGAWYGPEGSGRMHYHLCALRESQTVTCWGADDFGQASPPAGMRFRSVSAGGKHTCGITIEEMTRCWGADDAGQSTPPDGAAFVEVTAVHDSSCGLLHEGDVVCWGDHELSAPPDLVPFNISLPQGHSVDIKQLDKLDIIHGTECSTQRFCTDAPLTRATLAVWLDRLINPEHPQPVRTGTSIANFEDVPKQIWWAVHARRLAETNVMERCDAAGNLWCPDEEVARGDLEQILLAALEAHVRSLSPAVSRTAASNAMAAISADVLSTCIDHSPEACNQGPTSRGQAATVLNRFREHIERLTLPAFTSVATEGSSGCGRRADGTVECWGEDWTGQTHVATDDRVLDVFYDGYFWCGRTVSRDLRCHGWDGYNYSYIHESLHLASRTEIAIGSVYACGVETDGAVACVGALISDGSPWPWESASLPIPLTDDWRRFMPKSGRFTDVAVGKLHRCVLQLGGTAGCWGKNEFGEAVSPAAERFLSLALGVNHSCGIRLDGSIECWGYNVDGRSSPPTTRLVTPAAVSGPAAGALGIVRSIPARMKAIAATGAATCGLTLEGLVTCWGTSRSKRPPAEIEDWWNSHQSTVGPPTDIDGQVFASITATEGYFCAERLDGSDRCWGSSSFRRSPVVDASFVEVSANGYLTCGRRIDGSVQCWGGRFDASPWDTPNVPRFTGIATASTYMCGWTVDGFHECWTLDSDSDVPAAAKAGGFVQLSDSGFHSCVLTSDGEVRCWGSDVNGETEPPTRDSYVQISAGAVAAHYSSPEGHIGQTCGVKTDGSVDCWGDDSLGQSTPPAGNDFVKVAASGVHACALRSDGWIECWGQQLPLGPGPSDAHRYTDVVVGAGDSDWTSFGADDDTVVYSAHTCGLRVDGPVDCWGSTYTPNKPYNRHTPDARSRFTSISSGRSKVCGVRTDGAIECWGFPGFVAY